MCCFEARTVSALLLQSERPILSLENEVSPWNSSSLVFPLYNLEALPTL